MTIETIFAAAGDTLTGFVELATSFVTALWAHPLGMIFITAGIASVGVGLAYKVFFRKRRI